MKRPLWLAFYGAFMLPSCHSPVPVETSSPRPAGPVRSVHKPAPPARRTVHLPRVTRENVKFLFRDAPERQIHPDEPEKQLTGIQITAGGRTVNLDGPFETCSARQSFLEESCQLVDLTGDGVKDLVVPWYRAHRNDGYSVWVRHRHTGRWAFHDEVEGNVWPEPLPGGGFRFVERIGPMKGVSETWRWNGKRFVLAKTETIEPVVEEAH